MNELTPHKERIGSELKRVQEILQDADAAPNLDDWSSSFVHTLKSLIARHGESTFMSPRQWNALTRLERTLYGE